MDVVLPALILVAVVAAWVYLPVAPAVRELYDRTDVDPVQVAPESVVDVHHFARSYRRFLEAHLAQPFARCRNEGLAQRGQLEEGIPYTVVPAWDAHEPPVGMVLCCGTLHVPPRAVLRHEVYAAGSLRGGDESAYKSILAERDVELGPRSSSLRWLHAGGTARVGANGLLYGRASAGVGIELDEGCAFERLHAPRIQFGRALEIETPVVAPQVVTSRDLPDIIDISAGRWLHKGAMRLPAGSQLEADLVVTGDVRVGKGSRMTGSIKGRRDVYIGPGVEVRGSVVARRTLYLGEGCRIHGPVLAEKAIYIGAGTEVGSNDCPTTISAPRIHTANGVTAHGTVWAHREGLVAGSRLRRLKDVNGLNGTGGA